MAYEHKIPTGFISFPHSSRSNRRCQLFSTNHLKVNNIFGYVYILMDPHLSVRGKEPPKA